MAVVKRPGVVLVGKYRLIQPIGSGAMGTVWLADDMSARMRVAVKFMSDETADMRGRFVREARLSQGLSHPNIIKLIDVCETNDGEPFMVLELLRGQTLEQRLKQERRLAPKLAVQIVRDIARAIDSAHEAQIVHRDLKPANVFLHDEPTSSEEFVVKVLDFGIAKSMSLSNQTYATRVGTAVGSPAYMSPEQLAGADVDGRADLWALGIILYELIVGTRPFVGKQEEVVAKVLTAPTPSIRERMRGVPDEIERVVMLCLEKKRDKRMGSASELVSILNRVLATPEVWQDAQTSSSPNVTTVQTGSDVSAAPPDAAHVMIVPDKPVIMSSSPKRRREIRVMVATAVALLIVAVVAIFGLLFAGLGVEKQGVHVDVPTSATAAAHVASTQSFEVKQSRDVQPVASSTDVFVAASASVVGQDRPVSTTVVNKQGAPKKSSGSVVPNPYGTTNKSSEVRPYSPTGL